MPENDNDLKSDYRDLPIEGIISAPLKASARANSAMAVEQTKFLLDFCFAKDLNNPNDFKPVMVNLEYSRSFVAPNVSDPSQAIPDQPTSTMIQVPLLTLVPLNNLAVQTVKVDFDLEITRHKAIPTAKGKSDADKFGGTNVQLFGYVGSRKKSVVKNNESKRKQRSSTESIESSLSFEICAGPSPLPLGLTSIINAYSKAITPTPNKSSSQNP